jgi:hypothetical protein
MSFVKEEFKHKQNESQDKFIFSSNKGNDLKLKPILRKQLVYLIVSYIYGTYFSSKLNIILYNYTSYSVYKGKFKFLLHI